MQSRTEQRYAPNNQGIQNSVDMQYLLATGQFPVSSQAYMPSSTRGTVFSQAPANYSVDNLSHAFGSTNFHGLNNMGRPSTQSSSIANMGFVNGLANSQLYYILPDGRYYFPHLAQGGYQTAAGTYGLHSSQAHFLQQPSYQVNQALSNTPTTTWMSSRHTSAEVPELSAQRRNSYSSNEDNGPRTPFYGTNSQTEFQPRVSYVGHSPNLWNTPSPESTGQRFNHPIMKTANGEYTPMDLDALCQRSPEIPKPIPAIFSGEKGRGTLEKSLINNMNTTNVYIRGLHPDTTDDMLFAYGSRFGDIISAKSMLDQNTSLCKGYEYWY